MAGLSFLPVFLWTDLLIYLLLFVVLVAIYYIRQYPHLRTPWQSVLQRKRGIISVMILSIYVIIGLLDSFHFRPALPNQQSSETTQHYSSEVLSVLDIILSPLRAQTEKTYSAPFATHSFVKEMQQQGGNKQFDYVPLDHAGQHLLSVSDKSSDIQKTMLKASSQALFITFIVIFIILLLMAKTNKSGIKSEIQTIISGQKHYPVKTSFLVLTLLLLLGFNIAYLSVDYHVLGTDKVGQDVLYQTLKSIRTGLVIGTLTTLVMLPLAIFLGITAGYFRGWIDDIIQYLYTTLNSIPGVLLIAASVLMLQVYMDNNPSDFETIAERADLRLLFLCMILGVTSWTGLCRILRGETLKLREADFVVASKALGASRFRVLHRHILPNLMHIVIITVVLEFSVLVLAEAVLSYVGVGVDPTMISWGNMINSARLEMARDPVVWWSLTAAFSFMFVLVLAANLFADVVRDAFDPRTQGH